MADEDKVVEQPIDETTAVEEPTTEQPQEQEPVEEPTQEPSQEEPQSEEEPQPTEEPQEEPGQEEPPQQPSRRENLRIQNILKKYGPPQQRSQPQPQYQPQSGNQPMNYGQALNADPELIQQLEADRMAFAQQAFQQGMQQGGSQMATQADSQMWNTRLEIDAPKVSGKFPMLDKDSDQFHPAVANAVNQMYLDNVGFDSNTGMVQNANVRYADYVEGIFELAEEIASQKLSSTRKNIASQAANTGLRPDGSKAKGLNLNKAPQDMTNEELDAYIKQNMPAPLR